MKKNISLDIKLLVNSAIAGTISSFPIVGFFHGLLTCPECNGTFGLLERAFKGLIGAITTTLSLGKPYYNEAGIGGENIRLYVFIVAVAFTLLLFLISKRKIKKIKNNSL